MRKKKRDYKDKTCLVYRSVIDAWKDMSEDAFREFFLCYWDYATTGKYNSKNTLVKAGMELAKPSIESAVRRREASRENGQKGADFGNHGGRPRKGETYEEYKERKSRNTSDEKPLETPSKPLYVDVDVDDNVKVDKNVNADADTYTDVEVKEEVNVKEDTYVVEDTDKDVKDDTYVGVVEDKNAKSNSNTKEESGISSSTPERKELVNTIGREYPSCFSTSFKKDSKTPMERTNEVGSGTDASNEKEKADKKEKVIVGFMGDRRLDFIICAMARKRDNADIQREKKLLEDLTETCRKEDISVSPDFLSGLVEHIIQERMKNT